MQSDSALKRVKVTANHLGVTEEILETQSSQAKQENIVPIPEHIQQFLEKVGKDSQVITTIEEAREILADQTLFTNSGLVQLTKVT